jgi:hypothetical protein
MKSISKFYQYRPQQNCGQSDLKAVNNNKWESSPDIPYKASIALGAAGALQ